jgi:hypothetical protein
LRIGGERNVRRVPPASSEKVASFRQRTIDSSARFRISLGVAIVMFAIALVGMSFHKLKADRFALKPRE